MKKVFGMNIHPVETMAIIFIAMLIGIGFAKMFDKLDFFEEFMTKKYRKKYFLRKFHKELLSEKRGVVSVINMCFCDIRNRYDFRKLIIDEKKELIAKRKDLMEGIKYALSLCYAGVLSKKRETRGVLRHRRNHRSADPFCRTLGRKLQQLSDSGHAGRRRGDQA